MSRVNGPRLLDLPRDGPARHEAFARYAPPPFQPGKPVGNIYYGACSWTDRTLITSSTFYPETAKTAADRLAFYTSAFPIVEVDATYYALPSERNAHLWVERTPPGFAFTRRSACSPTTPFRSDGCPKR